MLVLAFLPITFFGQTRNLSVEGNGEQYGVIHSLDAKGAGMEFIRGDAFSETDWRIINENGVLRFQTETDNFATPGVNRFSLSEAGDFGLGCTNPQAKLSICSGEMAFVNSFAQSSDDKISLDGYGFGQPNMVGLGYETSVVSQVGGIIEYSDLYYKAEGSHRWYTNTNADLGASASMVLDRQGQLGLGTNTPDGKLEIAYNSTSGNPQLRLTESGTGIGRFEFRNTTNNNRYSFFISDPGATSPTMAFGYNDGTGSERILDLRFADGEAVLEADLILRNPNNSTYTIRTSGAGDLNFVGDGEVRMSIEDTNGDVGIGTTNPGGDLHLTRTGDAEILLEADSGNSAESNHPKLKFRQDGGITSGEIGYYNSTNDLRVINNSGGAAIVIKANGDIIIGKQ